MKTLIKGNEDVIKGFKYFECQICGWAGKAEKKEYKEEADDWTVECPCCGDKAYSVKDKMKLSVLINLDKRDAVATQ